MVFSWIPDAERDPHPRLTWFTECCFDLTVLALYRKEEIYPPDYRLEGGTLVVSNHQRDADVPILTTTLCRREGLRIRWPLPYYATREDLFRRGILADLAAGWPAPLPQLLGLAPLGWLFRIVRAEPMRRVREFTFGETLSAVIAAGAAAAHPAETFNARGTREILAELRRLPNHVAAMTQQSLGRLRLAFWGVRRLRREMFTMLRPQFDATIALQLSRFASHLNAGRVVYFAPEGTISRTGRFGRVRSGAWQLHRLAERPPAVLPCALSYDPFAPGRLRVVVRVGGLLRDMPEHNKRDYDARLRREILRGYAVTASHLIARFLAARRGTFSNARFAEWLGEAAAHIKDTGISLDPLLERSAIDELAGERLEWLSRKRLIEKHGRAWRNRWADSATPGWSKPARVVAYLDNGLRDVAELAPNLERGLRP